MATLPSQLNEFRSLEQLEEKEGRLLELLYQVKHSIVEESLQKQVPQAQLLKHSPFSKLPLILPSKLDRGSAKRITLVSSDLRTVTRNKDYKDETGVIRTDHLIPNSIPGYYFEITISQEENSMDCHEGG